jgi:hypothetical protein
MIKVDDKERVVRETTAPYEYKEKGELKTGEIRVRYYSETLAELKQQRNDAVRVSNAIKEGKADEIEFPWLSNKLAKKLESLPDLAGADGKPLKITPDNLDKLTAVNLRAIEAAIENDLVPKSQPSN